MVRLLVWGQILDLARALLLLALFLSSAPELAAVIFHILDTRKKIVIHVILFYYIKVCFSKVKFIQSR